MKKMLSTLGDITLSNTLEITPKTSTGSIGDGLMPMLSLMAGFEDDEYDPEGRKTMLMCPAPMTSKGDHSANGFSLDNLCSTPCYKAKIALRQKENQPDMTQGGNRYGLCIVKGEHRSTQEDRVSTCFNIRFLGPESPKS